MGSDLALVEEFLEEDWIDVPPLNEKVSVSFLEVGDMALVLFILVSMPLSVPKVTEILITVMQLTVDPLKILDKVKKSAICAISCGDIENIRQSLKKSAICAISGVARS